MSTLILDSTLKTIKVSMSSAATTTNPDFIVAYADNNGTSFTEGAIDGALTGTTDVTVVSAPASGYRRIIKNILIENKDTAAVTITIKYDNNGTQRTIAKVTLAVGDTWSTDGTYDTTGALKQTLSTVNLATQVTGVLPASNGGTGLSSAGTSGNILTSNGTAWVSQAAAAAGSFQSIQVFATAGTFTYTRPAGLTRALIYCTGAGGGAGYGGAGGGGGTAIKLVTAATLGATQTVTVGAGGTTANPGNAGGTSSFGALCSATGGSGGRVAGGAYPGPGGIGTGGDQNLRGQGADGFVGGFGGDSFWGGGGSGPSTDPTYSHGGGGSNGGGGGSSSGSNDYGGNGGPGYVAVWEYY